MTAALERAIAQNRWIVVTAWSPHWIFARWQLRYLDDPDHQLGGKERVHALLRRGFYQDYPSEVTEMLTRMYLPIEELEQALLRATQGSVDDAVDWYLREHQKRVKYWIDGDPG
jgi:glycine betaine/proline transport system substrate-binding protein